MAAVPIAALREAIRNLHGCDSTFVKSVPVDERFTTDPVPVFGGAREVAAEVVWQGAVCVFDLVGHRTAKRAYAWSHEAGEGGKRRFVAVLRAGPVDSPQAAVRASIVAEFRGRS